MKTFVLLLCLITHSLAYSQPVNRFMVVSDMHHYSPAADFSQTLTYELCIAAIEEQVDFIFFTGDLVIRSSSDDSGLTDWKFMLDTLFSHNIRIYACRGNNDISSIEAWNALFSGQYAFPQNGPEDEKNITYAIEYDKLLFIALDQYTKFHKINQEWLDEILEAKPKMHIFAAGHESAFKVHQSGTMTSFPEDRDLFWESLTKAGAKAFFCGHDHFYDHAIIDDGDNNPGNDIHQVIVGTGRSSFHSDAEYDGNNGRWTPERIFHEENTGYVLVEIIDKVVQITWKHKTDKHVFEDGGDKFLFAALTDDTQDILKEEHHFLVYPNPIGDKITIVFEGQVIKETSIEIMDSRAKVFYKKTLGAGVTTSTFNLSALSKALYLIKISNAEYTVIEKVIRK